MRSARNTLYGQTAIHSTSIVQKSGEYEGNPTLIGDSVAVLSNFLFGPVSKIFFIGTLNP